MLYTIFNLILLSDSKYLQILVQLKHKVDMSNKTLNLTIHEISRGIYLHFDSSI